MANRGREFSILAYNIQQPLLGGLLHQILRIHTEKSFLSTECLPHVVGKIGADVVVFTESFIASMRERLLILLKKYGYQWSTPVVNCNTSKYCNGGVVIVSKYPIVRIRHLEFKAASNVDGLAAKGVLYVEVDKHGFRHHILATHLNAFYDERDSAKVARRWQLIELRDFYSKLHIPMTEPVFIAGDLNIDKNTHEYSVMLNLLQSVHPKIDDSLESYTINTKNNEWTHDSFKDVWLDYVLYLKYHLKPLQALNKVLPVKWNGRDLSDHYPVLGLFKFV